MLTLDQSLEALALRLPRIGGDLSPYALPLLVTFERELYPYLVATLSTGSAPGLVDVERLKTFAEALTHTGRRQLIVRALDALVTDAYATLAASGHAVPDPTEPMKAPERAYVARMWGERVMSPSWNALRDALIAMAGFETSAAAAAERFGLRGSCACDLKATDGQHARTCPRRMTGAIRYVGEHVELTRDCDIGAKGERAIVSELNSGAMVLWFRDHGGRKFATGADYEYVRHVEGK